MTVVPRIVFLLLAMITIGQIPAVGQVFCIPKHSCKCSDEIVHPNLVVNKPKTGVHLRLHDETGAAFARNKIVLAKYKQGKVGTFREVAETSDQGAADFVISSAGEYRVLVQPARVWKQPSIICESTACTWSGTLPAEGTDQPYGVCPPK